MKYPVNIIQSWGAFRSLHAGLHSDDHVIVPNEGMVCSSTNITKHYKIQCDQKVSVHLIITIQKAGAQRLFDHPV